MSDFTSSAGETLEEAMVKIISTRLMLYLWWIPYALKKKEAKGKKAMTRVGGQVKENISNY